MGRRTTCLDPEQAHVGRDPAVETGLTKELPIDGLLSGPDSVVGPLEQSTDPTFRLDRPAAVVEPAAGQTAIWLFERQ